jgi:hypothetical protein
VHLKGGLLPWLLSYADSMEGMRGLMSCVILERLLAAFPLLLKRSAILLPRRCDFSLAHMILPFAS